MVVVLGMLFVIVSGGIDLSVGSVVALSAAAAGHDVPAGAGLDRLGEALAAAAAVGGGAGGRRPVRAGRTA